jgi:hypothetical protein
MITGMIKDNRMDFGAIKEKSCSITKHISGGTM